MIRATDSSDKNVNSWLVKTAMLCVPPALRPACSFPLRSPSSSFVAGRLVTYCNTACNNEEPSGLPRCCAHLRAAAAAGRALLPFSRVATSGRLFRPSTRARKSNPVLPYIRTQARVIVMATTPQTLNVSASDTESGVSNSLAPPLPPTCLICGLSFPSRNRLYAHLRTHDPSPSSPATLAPPRHSHTHTHTHEFCCIQPKRGAGGGQVSWHLPQKSIFLLPASLQEASSYLILWYGRGGVTL